MRSILIVFVIFIFSFNFAQAQQKVAAVSCISQPKNQKNINYIFFSFYQKSKNLKEYIPKNLVLVDSAYLKHGPRCLTSQAYSYFIEMNNALQKETGKNIVISSAWRSYRTQLYFAKTRGEFAATPGRSEHQLGTTIDIDILGAKEEDYFGDSDVYQWMKLHASEFGFVQSFRQEDTLETGIPVEPWHWRFVGKSIATKVTTENLNLSKFLYDRAQEKLQERLKAKQ